MLLVNFIESEVKRLDVFEVKWMMRIYFKRLDEKLVILKIFLIQILSKTVQILMKQIFSTV